MTTILLKVALVVVLYSLLFYVIFLKRTVSLSKIKEKILQKKQAEKDLHSWLAAQLPEGVSLLPPEQENQRQSAQESPEIF